MGSRMAAYSYQAGQARGDAMTGIEMSPTVNVPLAMAIVAIGVAIAAT